MVLYLVYNIKKNIHNLSSFAACCGTQRIWPSAVTRRTAIITTHGRMPRRPSGSACRAVRNGRHYAISARLGTTSARAVGSGGEPRLGPQGLPIFNEDTLFDTMQGKRTEDKILVENGIESIQDLSECYCQIRNKVSNLSKKVRDLVIKNILIL